MLSSEWYRCILCEVYCVDYEEHLASSVHTEKIIADSSGVPNYLFPCAAYAPREGIPSAEELWAEYFEYVRRSVISDRDNDAAKTNTSFSNNEARPDGYGTGKSFVMADILHNLKSVFSHLVTEQIVISPTDRQVRQDDESSDSREEPIYDSLASSEESSEEPSEEPSN